MRTPIILSCILALTAPAVSAEAIREVSATYNVNVGPMTMMVVRFGSSFSSDAVRSQATIKSKGISAVFSEFTARAEGDGRLDGQIIQPALFTLSRERDDRKKKTTIEWGDGGTITTDPPAHKKPDVRARIESALTPDVSDPITAILRVGTTAENPCNAKQRVFDGRDVFDLTLSDAGAGVKKKDGAYRGPVRNCRVRWHPVAGRSAERREPDGTYGISFAPLGTLASGQTFWLPVALSGTIKGLDFEVHMTKLKVDGGQRADTGTQN
ncbi:DUF3108 domain-containing protein [Aestuariivirga sp.]|uniref:DUF3108 domain-containing protein n=1 Tax=Aestuariivirga sp. TaxID=2650926 RepID=UPI0035932288